MNENRPNNQRPLTEDSRRKAPEATLNPAIIGRKEQRKIKARREQSRSIWYGLGMFGLVGWSIAIPTVIGVGFGVWLDQRWPQPFSFALMFLFVGVVAGCGVAWYWIKTESGTLSNSQDRTDSRGVPPAAETEEQQGRPG